MKMSSIKKRAARLILVVTVLAATAATFGAGTAAAETTPSWWVLWNNASPTHLQPGQKGMLLATAANSGDTSITGTTENPVVLTDRLPPGVQVEEKEGKEGKKEIEVEGKAGPEELKTGLAKHLLLLPCSVSGEAATGQTVECSMVGTLDVTETMRLKIRVLVSKEAAGSLSNTVEIRGGNALAAKPVTRTIAVSPAPTPFGVESYEIRPENAKGELETQAGGHPFQLTSTFDLNTTFKLIPSLGGAENYYPDAPALAKNLTFVLPPGLIGSAAGMPRCPGTDFAQIVEPGNVNICPEQTAIGYAVVDVVVPKSGGFIQKEVPVFNLEPEYGEPARFGFEAVKVPVVLTTQVRSGKDYGVEVTVHEATQLGAVLSTQLTLWGVPGDSRHDSARGWECLQEGLNIVNISVNKPCKKTPELEAEENARLREENKPPKTEPQAFLTLPTVCNAPETYATGEAWTANGEGTGATFPQEGETTSRFTFEPFTGCGALEFDPSINVTPDKTQAATPSGYTVSIHVPQEGTVSGKEGAKAEADAGITQLKLPPGVFSSAGAAEGLGTCETSKFGFEQLESELPSLLDNDAFTTGAVECPESSKVGTVEIETPLLEEHLTGYVYLAHEHVAPFSMPLVLFIFAESPTSHVQVKLAGEVKFEPNGQVVSTFGNTPPVPFSNLTLHLFDGPRAVQATPEKCGSYESEANFTSSAAENGVPLTHTAKSAFSINEGPGGGPCNPGFAPSFEAKADNPQAGAFSPFKVIIRKPDGENQLRSISVTEPPGAAAILADVTPCPTAIAEQIAPETLPPVADQSRAECPASSAIGESTAVAGLGTATYGAGASRVNLGGTVYLTGPYHGAPFGLLDVTNAEHVGPFDLGKIGVMSTINVNEHTAQAIVTSNPLPQFVEGVPASISEIMVNVNRPGFAFNPTNCNEEQVTSTLTGWGGPGIAEGVFGPSYPFHAANCSGLTFKPTITLKVESNYSRVDGTGMKIIVKSAMGQSNIHLTHLVFPKSVPSRLTTIQKACPQATFESSLGENCDEGSIIGTAIARTPVLKSPLTGNAYLVSHANESFPPVIFVLKGENGIKLVLEGKTFIHDGVTSSTFESVPDAPVESFEVSLPRGPHSAFSGYGDLCEKPIEVPTTFGGQNGAKIEGNEKFAVENCSKVLPAKKESELAKLLKKCSKAKKKLRAKCDATARKQVKAVASCKAKNKKSKSKQNKCIAQARKKYALKLK